MVSLSAPGPGDKKGKDSTSGPRTSASACLGSAGEIGKKGIPFYPLRKAGFRAASATSASAYFRVRRGPASLPRPRAQLPRDIHFRVYPFRGVAG